jgi:hypothetical protein
MATTADSRINETRMDADLLWIKTGRRSARILGINETRIGADSSINETRIDADSWINGTRILQDFLGSTRRGLTRDELDLANELH